LSTWSATNTKRPCSSQRVRWRRRREGVEVWGFVSPTAFASAEPPVDEPVHEVAEIRIKRWFCRASIYAVLVSLRHGPGIPVVALG